MLYDPLTPGVGQLDASLVMSEPYTALLHLKEAAEAREKAAAVQRAAPQLAPAATPGVAASAPRTLRQAMTGTAPCATTIQMPTSAPSRVLSQYNATGQSLI